MPLLHGKPFKPRQIPPDLKPDEEVFVCPYTKEVFRNYEDFFNRQFLCTTFAWSCELTGQHDLTYEQAAQSEREAQAVLDSIQDCMKQAILSLLHHSFRTNVKTVVDEVTSFFKDRFVLGEELEYFPNPGEKRSSKHVKVLSVVRPQASPVKMSVITVSPYKSSPSPGTLPGPPGTHINPSLTNQTLTSDNVEVVSSTTEGINGVAGTSPIVSTPSSSKPTPKQSPISSQVKLSPVDYQYIIQDLDNKENTFTTTFKHLSRPKTAISKEKIKLFLKNALYRDTDKHPLLVKLEYIKKYNLGPTSIPLDQISVTPGSSRKRNLSQSSLDSFFITPHSKKMKPSSLLPLNYSKPKKKSPRKSVKTPGGSNRRKSRASVSSNTASTPKSPTKSSKAPKTPKSKGPVTPMSIEAKKALKKAKKQLDLRKSLVKKKGGKLTEQEILEMRKLDKKHREDEKEKIRQDKLRRKQELRQKQKIEKQKKTEWLKPREDTLCEDSVPLPSFGSVFSLLSPELFDDSIMILEFLYHYGPVFNIKDVLHTTITFEKLEEALVSNSPDTILYGVIKFLLQTIFAAMEEEHESLVEVSQKQKQVNSQETEPEEREESISSHSRTESRRSSVGSIPVEGMEEEQERSRDVRVAALKSSAAMYAKWPQFTQATPLYKLAFDPYTCSEILRLHLLSSGGYNDDGDRTWFRYCNRGGYTDSDDPVLELRLNHPEVLEALSTVSVYDLSPANKLQILFVLSSQLLMFAASRDYIEELKGESKKLRKQIRELQFSLSEKKKKDDKNKKDKKKAAQSKKPEELPKDETTIKISNDKPEELEKNEVHPSSEVFKTPAPKQRKKTRSQGPVTPLPGEVTKPDDVVSEETETNRKERIKNEIQELENSLYPINASINLRPLGLDRHYNQYWFFPSLPGLFVELSKQDDTTIEQMANLEGDRARDTCISELNTLQNDIATDNKVKPSVKTMSTPLSKKAMPSIEDTCITDHLASIHKFNSLALPLKEIAPVNCPEFNHNTTKPMPPKEDNPTNDFSNVHKSGSLAVPALNETPLNERTPVISLARVRSPNSTIQSGHTTSEDNPNLSEVMDLTSLDGPSSVQQVRVVQKPISSNKKWCCLTSKEEIKSLLETLNPRGQREVMLKQTIEKMLPLLDDSVSKCPVSKDCADKRSSLQLETCAEEILELYLREQILDIEEKIWMGNLGLMKNLKDRTKWRHSIETSGAAKKYNKEDCADTVALINGHQDDKENAMKMEVSEEKADSSDSVRELARALLQIQEGIEKKCLLPPLGTATDIKKKGKDARKNGLVKVKESDLCLEQWRASLQKANSFSQIFVHLSTLERAVAWSKSLMNVRCRICRRKGGDEYMLLCDGCDHGYHTYCLRPPLFDIPEDDWFCYDCCPVTPMKRRRTVSTVSMKESSDSESESDGEVDEDMEEAEDDVEEEEDSEEEMEIVQGKRSLRSSTVVQRRAITPKRATRQSKQKWRSKTESKVGAVHAKSKLERKGSELKTTSKAKKKLKLDSSNANGSTSNNSLSKAEVIISSIIDIRCAKRQGSAQRKAQQTLEFQLCKALLDELMSHNESWPFLNPIRRRKFPDYYDVIVYPMDFKTIRQKLSNHKYNSLDQFLHDIDLIFSNCATYFKRNSKEARAGLTLKRFMEQRYNDLGLRDLTETKHGNRRSSTVELRSSSSRH